MVKKRLAPVPPYVQPYRYPSPNLPLRALLRFARPLAAAEEPLRDLVCFHCQQSAEKYLKALLQDLGAVVPKTHDLEDLLDLLLPHDATLAPLRRALHSLTRYAVDFRYPNYRTTTR